MKTQTQKTEQKRELYQQGNYWLSLDSLNEQVINPQFQAIDGDLYIRKVRREYLNPREQELLRELKTGNKIRVGSVF